jgi:hypothetical protein
LKITAANAAVVSGLQRDMDAAFVVEVMLTNIINILGQDVGHKSEEEQNE